jgi:predicted PurR-regulated permease PerM
MTPSQTRALLLSLLLLVGFGLLLHAVSEILTPFIVGLILAYLINPIVNQLEAWGLPRPLAATLPVAGAVSLLALGLVLGVPLLVEQLTNFARRLPVYLMTLEHFVLPERLGRQLGGLLDLRVSTDAVLRQLGLLGAKGAQWTVTALQQTLSGAVWLLNILLVIVMTPLVAFYLLMDWPSIMKKTVGQLPNRWRASVRQAAAEIDQKLAAYLRGTLSVCLGMALFYAVALSLVGPLASLLRGEEIASMELAWAIGLMTGLLTFLPIIGASIGVFTMLAVALVQYQLQVWEPYALILGLFVLGQSLEGYVMTPTLVGNRVGLHPLWIIFALLAGGALAGVVGMLLAIPVAVVISVLLPRLMKLWRESLE